jgi:hypothetical protein
MIGHRSSSHVPLRSATNRVIALLVIAVVLFEVFLLTTPWAALTLLALASWFALPGIVLVRQVLSRHPAAAHTAWMIGPAIGFGFSVAGLLMFWAAGVQNWIALVAAPLLTLLLATVVKRWGGLDVRLPTPASADLAAVLLALLIVPAITLAPYANVRAPVPDGEAYRAYFTADFIWAMSVTSELAKGEVPPVNPFHRPEAMHYYWLAHMLSGAIYRNVQPLGVLIEPVILIDGLAFGLAFVAFAYWLARSVGATPLWACAAVIVGFLANSYEGADMIRAIFAGRDRWAALRDTNIDAVSRWFYQGMAVDGLHRLLLYQPHHLTGYVMSLGALWMVGLAADIRAVGVAFTAGALLALGLLFSTFGAIIVSVAVMLLYAVRIVQQRAYASAIRSAVVAGVPLLLGVWLTRVLGYTRPEDGMLMTFGLNPVALRNVTWVVFISFGPLLLIGVPAFAHFQWLRRAGAVPATLVASALAFYFFVDVPDMGGVWVGWRSGHMLLIGFAAAAAAGMTAVWSHTRSRWAVLTVAIPAVLLAVPTVAIDVFNAQDISNRREGVGFPWTLVITPGEREALNWIRTNTPPDAIVQPEPYVRDPATWAYVSAFAERRMAAGLPISMIPRRPYELASDDVRRLFLTDSPSAAHNWATFLGIDYLLIGDRERRAYGRNVLHLQARPDLFATVFSNDAIVVLQVVKAPDAAVRLKSRP